MERDFTIPATSPTRIGEEPKLKNFCGEDSEGLVDDPDDPGYTYEVDRTGFEPALAA